MGPVRNAGRTVVTASNPNTPARRAASETAPLQFADSSGRTRFAGLLSYRAGAGDPATVAQRFLTAGPDWVGLPAGQQPALSTVRTDTLGSLHFVRLQQVIEGVPVHGSETVVGMTSENTVISVARGEFVAPLPEGEWIIGSGRAVEAALAARSIQPFEPPRAERIWYPANSRLVPAWRVIAGAMQPPADWEILVDARNGAVLQATRSVQAADGSVFPRNPALDRTPRRTPLQNLEPGPTLTGRFASITSAFQVLIGQGTSLTQFARSDAQGNFVFGLDDPRFEEVQLYYGIDAAHARFRQLGFDRLDRPVEGVVYWPEAFQQGPFFLGSAFQGRGGIFFAPAPPRFLDPTWDTDVIFHEYTHAVVFAAVGATRSRGFGALNEGFADYFSSSFQDDANVGEYAGPLFGARTPYLRTIENPNQYPRDLFNEVHQASLIWSGALWDIRRTIGPAQADLIALATLLSLRGDSDFVPAGIAAVTAANALFGAPARASVLSVMQRRGILTPEGVAVFNALDLTSGVPLPGRAPAGRSDTCVLEEQRQYRINVLPGVTELGVALAGLQRNLQLFARYRRPVTLDAGRVVADFEAEPGSVGGFITLNSTPELQAGFYYLAVVNCNDVSVDYQIGAIAEGGSADTPALLSSIPPGLAVSGAIPAGPLLNSRQFTIQVPAGATSLRVTVTANANVDLFAQFGRPLTLNDMGMPAAEAFATSAGNSETLIFSAMTTPNLRPGTWYFGIYNRDETQVARYSITAAVSSTSGEQARVTSIVSDTRVDTSLPAASAGSGVLAAQQYSITVPATAQRLTLTASSSSDTLVFIRLRNAVEVQNGRALYDYVFDPAQTSTFEITRESMPPLEAATVYYVAVANYSPSPGSLALSYRIATAQSLAPLLSNGGVVNGASFTAPISAGSWVSIVGGNLASTTRTWTVSDFDGARLPVQLDGTSVTINGRPAYVAFISPSQVNVLAPDDSTEGPVDVRVTNASGQSTTVSVLKSNVAPALFTFTVPNQPVYTAAVHPDGVYAGRPGLFGTTTPTRAVRPGGRILLFGTGFGAVAGAPPPGQAFSGAARLLGSVRVRIGGVDAVVEFAGLILNGLYQFNVIVPEVPAGDHAVNVSIDGVATQPGVLLTIER
jgi:uncharacterized protein (TIGR03437 family)